MKPLSHYDSDHHPGDPYPESDGKPMAESTEQYEWLVKIKENLECLFAGDPEVFVAGDLFWYPLRDRSVADAMAPDVMVAFGRPKGLLAPLLQTMGRGRHRPPGGLRDPFAVEWCQGHGRETRLL